MFKQVSQRVLGAIASSPSGIASLDVLESLGLCGMHTLLTTLSRLNKSGKIARLKRGCYSILPFVDSFACAQSVFKGYLGFSSALYLHSLASEMPYTIVVVTAGTSRSKKIGQFEFKAVSLKEKAVGFEQKGALVVSTRAKTLFDCLYLPKYSVELPKLINSFRQARLSAGEWREFRSYCGKFAAGRFARRVALAEMQLRTGRGAERAQRKNV